MYRFLGSTSLAQQELLYDRFFPLAQRFRHIPCCKKWMAFVLSAGLFTSSVVPQDIKCIKRKSSLFLPNKWKCDNAAYCSKNTEKTFLGQLSSFHKGELFEIKIHNGKNSVLVANINGKLYCSGNSCSHYSAALHRGVGTKEETVACPWHDAEFSLKTGECVNGLFDTPAFMNNPAEEFLSFYSSSSTSLAGPGLKSIPVFPLTIENNDVYADIPIEDEFEENMDAPMAKRDPNNKIVFGIVGAGAAALTAAEQLRKEGFTGRILMIGREEHPPYDRPVLSKNLNAKIEKLYLRDVKWLQNDASIELFLNKDVQKVDTQNRIIQTADGETFKCDKILIATGGVPRRLNIPGSDLRNIEVLRSYDDMKSIAARPLLDTPIVVIGSSFIGMEIAAALGKAGAKVTILGMEKVPFERVLGEKIGKQVAIHLNQKRVVFRPEKKVVKFVGSGGKVSGVVLENGEILQTDLVILGVGVVPNTDMVEGVEKLKDKSLKVDPFMQVTGAPHVYAAGDIATFPFYKSGEHIRVEHWDVAMSQGRTAAKHMMGKFEPYDKIPFFWTMLLGKSIRYAGYCSKPDDILFEGDVAKLEFAAFYIKDDQIQAVATCHRDPAAVAAVEALKHNLMPDMLQYQMGFFNAKALIQTAKENIGCEIYNK